MKTFFNYFSSVKLEMKKVSWSSKQELIGSTVIVFVFAIILGIFLWFLAVFWEPFGHSNSMKKHTKSERFFH